MAIKLFFILLIGLPAFYFSDMDSPSRFYAYVLPITSFACVIALALWIVAWFARRSDAD